MQSYKRIHTATFLSSLCSMSCQCSPLSEPNWNPESKGSHWSTESVAKEQRKVNVGRANVYPSGHTVCKRYLGLDLNLGLLLLIARLLRHVHSEFWHIVISVLYFKILLKFSKSPSSQLDSTFLLFLLGSLHTLCQSSKAPLFFLSITLIWPPAASPAGSHFHFALTTTLPSPVVPTASSQRASTFHCFFLGSYFWLTMQFWGDLWNHTSEPTTDSCSQTSAGLLQ